MSYDKEAVSSALGEWVKEHRDEFAIYVDSKNPIAVKAKYEVLDTLLDEVREAGVLGMLPWEELGE